MDIMKNKINQLKKQKYNYWHKKQARKQRFVLAQGGICVMRDKDDYDSFFEDTMKAGHYENKAESVDIMIRLSKNVIEDLVSYGVRFETNSEGFVYTREGAHSKPRILFHKDETGKEITSHLLERKRQRISHIRVGARRGCNTFKCKRREVCKRVITARCCDKRDIRTNEKGGQ